MAALYGVHLKRLRERRGWTQRDLAARVFVSPGRVAQLECASGARPTAELTRALDDALEGAACWSTSGRTCTGELSGLGTQVHGAL